MRTTRRIVFIIVLVFVAFWVNDMNTVDGYVYVIHNTIDDQQYVGSTTRSVNTRWQEHLASADDASDNLHKTMRRYGIEYFSIEVLETVRYGSANALSLAEERWISQLDTYNNGLNSRRR